MTPEEAFAEFLPSVTDAEAQAAAKAGKVVLSFDSQPTPTAIVVKLALADGTQPTLLFSREFPWRERAPCRARRHPRGRDACAWRARIRRRTS